MAGALSTIKGHHYPALPFSRFREFLERLRGYRGRVMTGIAAELSCQSLSMHDQVNVSTWASRSSTVRDKLF